MAIDLELTQMKRRRGNMLKLIRQGHEKQLDRMNDSFLQKMMRDIGASMSSAQVLTMLQDLQELNYLTFEQSFCDIWGRFIAEKIMLTAPGAALVVRRQDNEEVLFS